MNGEEYGNQTPTGKSGKPWSGPPVPPPPPPTGPGQPVAFDAATQWSQGPPPKQLASGRKRGLLTIGIGVGLVFMLGVAGIVLAGNPNVNPPAPPTVAKHHHATVPVVSTPTPAAVPSPDGKFSGSCDYTLGYPAADHVVGEVDLTNTGNIGTVVKVEIEWPQEGSPYITMHRTVRTAAGSKVVVRFRKVVSETQISLLQSWQERHGFKDGCVYHAVITDAFGSVQP